MWGLLPDKKIGTGHPAPYSLLYFENDECGIRNDGVDKKIASFRRVKSKLIEE